MARCVFCCYSNADLRKGEEVGEVLRFVSFWENRYGEKPKELVFDSKLTTLANLSRLNRQGISLRGYERSQGRQIFRRFLDTTARVVVSKGRSRGTAVIFCRAACKCFEPS